MDAKICFITAIFGNYEHTCKKYAKQTVPTDFICFTDSRVVPNGWQIDITPYHLINKSPLDNDTFNNSINRNKHTFNIAKYYKTAFQNIPRLKKYTSVVWLDGTIEIIDPKTSEYILNNIESKKIITWHHEWREGILKNEVGPSNCYRYTSTFWNGQVQTFQDVNKQYQYYIDNGYTDEYFKERSNGRTHFGVWITCFVAFSNKDPEVTEFLNKWFLEILTHTTQDQISFPYVVQKSGLLPHTLPDEVVTGDKPHENTQFYIKHTHGK
jgi:hypothetical protein